MKIKAIITDDGKMYKLFPASEDSCIGCAFKDDKNACNAIAISCDDLVWKEVPEITDKEIEDYLAVHRFITHTQRFDVTKAMDWYKKQLKQRLEE